MQLEKLPRMIVVKHAPQANPVGGEEDLSASFGVSARLERSSS